METDLVTMILSGANTQKAMERLRITKDELVELWFEQGVDLIDRIRHDIRYKTAFDKQFGNVRHLIGFKELTPEQVFDTIRMSPHFWSWWLNCLVGVCTRVNRFTGGRADRFRGFLFEHFGNINTIPDFVIERIFNDGTARKTFKIRRTPETQPKERHHVCAID